MNRLMTTAHSPSLICLALLAITSCGAPAPTTDAVLYEGARLIVGDGGVIENGAFVVENGEFVQVGAAGEVEAPAGAPRQDLSGMTVMPAIVDTHVHMSTERDALIEDLRQRARFGISAALSLGRDAGETPLQVRDEELPGIARFRTAGLGVTAPEPGRTEDPHWVTTEEEAREAVRTEAARNVDIIKVWVDDRNGQFEKLAPELYRAVIDEAHQHNLRVTAHLFHLEDAKELMRAGIDAFAHGIRDVDVDDEVMAMFAERPDFVVAPNLPNRGVATDPSWLSGSIPSDRLESLQAATDNPQAQEAFGIQARNLARLSAAGVIIAVGSDGNDPWAVHIELEDMVAAGMTPAEVIVAATRNSADFMRLDDSGTIEDGKRADFLVLEANPLDDITNTRRIAAVYLAGSEVDRSGE